MKIQQDKLSHFLAGIAIAAVFFPFGIGFSIVAVIAIAALKELWDMQGNGTPEFLDFAFTVVGGIALLCWFLINQIKF